ncbi:hypothetical protein A3I53_04520 [Candidatus Curtissbacteria bacterium RIFCSPLOWO2_02_FULL_40_13b]|uniref:Glycosyltransferase 2-like domain-containing protein n=1 Tax=Candidatus Curtissbacteria bacterium RIFCSPLOWO2_02_FULL_40_13b TaxID=1797733 RepID=A0A1F5HVA3_9BACT|nr:MAG: hypothetical protein A3I53_04520 [Candidatus Curtissbacteria bacterium RIFCSPLOWO2_02_FULL_40_13b]
MKKFTLTIGIPAHNEEGNIRNMIESVLKQKGPSFKLEEIIVVLDGCTDNTLKIVREIAAKNNIVKVFSDGKRTGKAKRLNQIFRLNKSQLIGTFDADIVLERDCELELMVRNFLKDDKVKVVAARQLPIHATSLMGRFSNASFMMLQTAAMLWRNGNNIHLLQGSASIIKSSFAKSFKFPPDTATDAGYLYLMATKNGRNGFKFEKNTKVIFRAVSTFADWRKLGARTIIYNKENLSSHFGRKIQVEYQIPKKFILKAILYILLRDPIGAVGSALMNLYIRKVPYNFKTRAHNLWEITKSSKALIKI